ncbi:MAG: YdcF family protein [Coriobacteriales bacterium]|nr:YdcF family protein [Coriobacteriales bacterium]
MPLLDIARGIACFLATYCLIGVLAFLAGTSYNLNIWWIDLTFLPMPLVIVSQIALAVVLYAFVLRVPAGLPARLAGAALCLLFAGFAVLNAVAVFAAAAAGDVRLGFPLPFSLFIAAAFVCLAAAIGFGVRLRGAGTALARRRRSVDAQASGEGAVGGGSANGKRAVGGSGASGKRAVGGGSASGEGNFAASDRQAARSLRPALLPRVFTIAATVVTLGVLFPVGQILCFGTTTYNGRVDACVVLGAQVLPDGTPSKVLQDRLDTAIAFYRAGNARALIMSGGVDIGGVDEAEAMREYALAQGLPAADILVDAQGANTQATARDTVALMREHGFERVAAVSNYYHLARVKMLFLAEGVDVMTVPCVDAKAPLASALTVLREVPGWWYYWFATIGASLKPQL